MPKQLVLMRHAKSDWSVSGQRDFDRELNYRGHRDGPLMGARLKMEKQFIPELVVSSPAVRAKLTARYVCEQIGYLEEDIVFEEDVYEASVRTLLRIINTLDDKYSNVIIFGHNPGFSYLSEYLTKETIGDLPTASIINIQFSFDSWALVSEGTGSVNWCIFPKDND